VGKKYNIHNGVATYLYLNENIKQVACMIK